LVFEISVNDAGDVTVAQFRALDHGADGNDHDSQVVMASGLVGGQLTVTDNDTDTATSNTVELGALIAFEDDGPAVNVAAVSEATLALDALDESPGPNTVADPNAGDDEPASLGAIGTVETATGAMASLFVADGIDYGTDGAAATDPSVTDYALVLGTAAGALVGIPAGTFEAAEGVATTLYVTGDGDGLREANEQIYLFKISDTVIEGRADIDTNSEFEDATAGEVALRLTLDPSGFGAGNPKLTVDQILTIEHADDTDPDDTETLGIAGSPVATAGISVKKTTTVTDGDEDTATDSAEVNVTASIAIEDDGPVPVLPNTDADTLVLDETRPVGSETDGDSDPAGLDTVTADFADNFGAGGGSYALALNGSDVSSGLYALDATDTTGGDGDGIGQGDEIVLNQSINTITGSANSTDYFTISIDPTTGVVTFTQSNNIWHSDPANDDETETLTMADAGDLQVTQTVVDDDGDSESASIDLGAGVFQIEDDGPTVNAPDGTLQNDDGESLTELLVYDTGSDGLGRVDLTAPTVTSNSVTHILKSLGATVEYSIEDTGSDGLEELYGYIDTSNNNIRDGGERLVFTLAPTTPGASAGDYTLTMNDPVDLPQETLTFTNENIKAGGPAASIAVFTDATQTTSKLLISGSGVNANSAFVGIANNVMEPGETITYEFGTVDTVNFTMLTRDLINNADLSVANVSGPGTDDLSWVAYTGGPTTGTFVGSGTISWDGPGENPPAINASGPFDTLVFTVPAAGGGGDDNAFKMGGISYTNLSDPEPVVLSIPFTVTDGDGDIATDPDADGVFVVNIIPGDGNPDVNIAPPVVLDLDGDGLEFVAMGDASNHVLFDFNGDGTKETAAWVGPDDGFLVYDANGDRRVNDGSEIAFADMTAEADTDLEALRTVFDSNHDGLLTEADEQFSRFGVWQDANGNGSTEGGEFKTLTEMGIVSHELISDGERYSAANGQVTVYGEASFTYQDGSQGLVGDVSLAIGGPADSSADSQVGGAGQDLMLSRQANDLRLAVYGSTDQATGQNWYGGTDNQVDTIQTGNGQTLLSSQVNQLIDAMASFTSTNNGMAWDAGIAAKPLEVQEVLAASWQS
jgi:hypothetical protein